MSIAEELKAKTPEKKIWTPPVSKVPASAVTPETPAPVFGGTPPSAPPTPLKTMNGPKGHVATIIKQTDPAQKFPFLVNCTCQFQGRAKTEVDIRTTVQRHFERYE